MLETVQKTSTGWAEATNLVRMLVVAFGILFLTSLLVFFTVGMHSPRHDFRIVNKSGETVELLWYGTGPPGEIFRPGQERFSPLGFTMDDPNDNVKILYKKSGVARKVDIKEEFSKAHVRGRLFEFVIPPAGKGDVKTKAAEAGGLDPRPTTKVEGVR
jgi:hypothetical protein